LRRSSTTPAARHIRARSTAARRSDAAAEFLRFIEFDRQRKPSALRDYRSMIDNHLLPAFATVRLEE
jgi:hypothetical protein